MQRISRLWPMLALCVAFALSSSLSAEVRLPRIFGDNMVLQAGKPVKVWGWADSGDLVVVNYGKHVRQTRAVDGRWSVELPKMKADATLRELRVLTDGSEIGFKNVVVGEVWVASGQSNMQWSLTRSENWTQAAAASTNPDLRLFYVPRVKAAEPQEDISGRHLDKDPRWETAGPASTPEFSAVAYYFARDLQAALKVPVGIVHTSWGGSPAEVWMSEEVLAAKHADLLKAYEQRVANYERALERHRAAIAKAKAAKQKFKGRAPRKPWVPGELYNAMIHPLLNFSMRGSIWYQGESNAGRAYEYRTLFANMIRNWRADWGQGDFPFLAVELAPYDMRRNRSLDEIARRPLDSAWAELREAQILASKVLKNVATVTITDVGTKDDIHPPKKEPVGARLALAARGIAYGEKLAWSGPAYRSHQVTGGKFVIRFDHVNGGLEARGGALSGFAIAGKDGKFVWGNAEIVGDTVVVTHPNIDRPKAVRFGWADYPVVNFWNKAGLPAHPFRTDSFPLTTKPK